MDSFRVLFVCMGNICRSPTAEGVFRHQVARAGLDARVLIDSAGTHGYHVGAPPDARSRRHALRRGYDLSALRARQVAPADFGRFDLILAMDDDNLAWLQEDCPTDLQGRLHLLMEFAPGSGQSVVPDPYQGGEAGFEAVLDLVEQACNGLLEHVRQALRRRDD